MNRVTAAWDPETQVWYVTASTVPGLHLEGATMDELYARLPDAIEDLLDNRVPFDFVVHGKGDHDIWHDPRTRQRVTVPVKLMPRRTANDILKDAGLPKAS
jgi:predicted RNase H-like HicB family nuclease